MPTVVGILFALTSCVLIATGLLIAFALARRKQRERQFREVDELRRLSFPIISSLAAGKLDYPPALQALREVLRPSRDPVAPLRSPDPYRGLGGTGRGDGASGLDTRASALDRIERVLFGARSPRTIPVPVLRQLAVDFGLVELWERRLLGRFEPLSLRQAVSRPASVLERVRPLSFLLRARSAERLGTIRHQPSWRALVVALDDPHSEVRSAAARALGAIAEPESFAPLIERLYALALQPSAGLSFRDLKAALISFPLEQAGGLAKSLVHDHPRVRFLATDVIREMVERRAGHEQAFLLRVDHLGPELTELFVTRLVFDENPDVRARAAPVIARLNDPRSVERLVTLLGDSQWFVRLHTIRASAQPRLAGLAEPIARRLSDPNWRVRETAVRTLLSFGPTGAKRLLEHFLATQDRYSLEQIAEELQRSNLLPIMLADLGDDGEGRLEQLVERLIRVGKSNCVLALLQSGADRGRCERLLEHFAHKTTTQARP